MLQTKLSVLNYLYLLLISLTNQDFAVAAGAMGIAGLLPFLKASTTQVNIRQFEGQTVAVDTYCWIYRGAFSCAEELALGKKADG